MKIFNKLYTNILAIEIVTKVEPISYLANRVNKFMPLINIVNTLLLTIQENWHHFHTKKMHSLLGIDGTKLDFPSETFDITFFFFQ
jgi:hypothetical protein